MKRLQLLTRLDPELRDRVSKAAGDEGISLNDLVIKALENYLGIPKDRSDNTVDNSSAITTLAERITALESNAINGDNSTDSISVINDRFEALESEIKAIREELKAIVESGKTPPKTEPKPLQANLPEGVSKPSPKTKTIAPGVGTIADQILQLMADGREWDTDDLMPHFPGKKRGTITSALSRMCTKEAIVNVSPAVHKLIGNDRLDP